MASLIVVSLPHSVSGASLQVAAMKEAQRLALTRLGREWLSLDSSSAAVIGILAVTSKLTHAALDTALLRLGRLCTLRGLEPRDFAPRSHEQGTKPGVVKAWLTLHKQHSEVSFCRRAKSLIDNTEVCHRCSASRACRLDVFEDVPLASPSTALRPSHLSKLLSKICTTGRCASRSRGPSE